MVHGTPCRGVGTLAAYRVVGWRVDTVDRDLHVEVIHRRETAGGLTVDEGPVGGELDPDAMVDRVRDELEEVAAHHRFAATDVHVEDLHAFELVDERLRLGRGELAWIADTRRRKAVHALEVARV